MNTYKVKIYDEGKFCYTITELREDMLLESMKLGGFAFEIVETITPNK